MRKLFPLFLIFFTVLILFFPVLTTYFSQDDFFHFKVSMTDGSLKGFINLFGFHQFEERGIAFYRPLSRELLFNPYYLIFGLNPIPFRILQLLIHLINIYLVFLLVQKLFQKLILSFFIAFFFGISSVHVASLYYLAGGIQAHIATTFIILTIILFIQFLLFKNLKFLYLSFLTFIFGLASHELAVVIPMLLLSLIFVYLKSKKALKKIYLLMPFFIVCAIYIYLEVFTIGFSSKEAQYNLVFNIKTTFNSLFWYTGWALGLPEMLIDFVLPGFKLNPNLMKYWGNYFTVIFSAAFISIILLVFISILLLVKKTKIFFNKKLLFLAAWFLIGIFPVLLLPLHKSTYYLPPVLPAFWTVIGFLTFGFYEVFRKRFPKVALIIVSLLFLSSTVLSITSVKLGEETFWAAQRGKIAKKLIDDIQNTYPTLPKSAIVYFKNDPTYPFLTEEWGGTSKQASLILNGSDALQLLYKDPTIKVLYEDLDTIPKDSEDNIFYITARI